MTRFFRNFRIKAINKKKVSKYLLYATGEILLVVIGILIALWINGIYDQDKRLEKERLTLIDLKDEFTSNLALAKQADLELRNKLNAKIELLKILDSDGLREIPETKLFQTLFGIFAYDFNVDMETGKLDALIYSGEIKNISNTDLKNKLAGWNSKNLIFKNQLNIISQKRVQANDLIIKSGNYREILQYFQPYHDTISFESVEPGFEDSMKVLESAEFENRVLELFTMFMNFNYELMPGYIKRLEQVIVIIDMELE
ncbi:MAG: hypothetical protein WBA16_06050 [Nonlabens sp.]